jgi:hypothetical protein
MPGFMIYGANGYAMNLERFLRSLALPMTISIGEPKQSMFAVIRTLTEV